MNPYQSMVMYTRILHWAVEGRPEIERPVSRCADNRAVHALMLPLEWLVFPRHLVCLPMDVNVYVCLPCLMVSIMCCWFRVSSSLRISLTVWDLGGMSSLFAMLFAQPGLRLSCVFVLYRTSFSWIYVVFCWRPWYWQACPGGGCLKDVLLLICNYHCLLLRLRLGQTSIRWVCMYFLSL